MTLNKVLKCHGNWNEHSSKGEKAVKKVTHSQIVRKQHPAYWPVYDSSAGALFCQTIVTPSDATKAANQDILRTSKPFSEEKKKYQKKKA